MLNFCYKFVTNLLQLYYNPVTSAEPYGSRRRLIFIDQYVPARPLYFKALASCKLGFISWDELGIKLGPASWIQYTVYKGTGQLEGELGSWDKLRKLELRRRAEIARENFLSLTLFRSWIPEINHTNFWLAASCATLDEIGNA